MLQLAGRGDSADSCVGGCGASGGKTILRSAWLGKKAVKRGRRGGKGLRSVVGGLVSKGRPIDIVKVECSYFSK